MDLLGFVVFRFFTFFTVEAFEEGFLAGLDFADTVFFLLDAALGFEGFFFLADGEDLAFGFALRVDDVFAPEDLREGFF